MNRQCTAHGGMQRISANTAAVLPPSCCDTKALSAHAPTQSCQAQSEQLLLLRPPQARSQALFRPHAHPNPGQAPALLATPLLLALAGASGSSGGALLSLPPRVRSSAPCRRVTNAPGGSPAAAAASCSTRGGSSRGSVAAAAAAAAVAAVAAVQRSAWSGSGRHRHRRRCGRMHARSPRLTRPRPRTRGEVECGAVDADALPAAHVQVHLHGLRRVDVHRPHEPARPAGSVVGV
jgi:hypothetical protein